MPEESNKETQRKETAAENGAKKRFALRTLRADTADFVKSKKFSLVDMVAMKQRAKEKQPFMPSTDQASFSKNKLIVIALICLIAIVAGAYFFIKNTPNTANIQRPNPPPPALITSQEEKVLTVISLSDLKNKITEALNSSYAAGDLIYFALKKNDSEKYFTSKDFFFFVQTETPAELTTFLENNFFLGIINLTKRHPVLIFEAKKGKYESVFSGMLQWENTMVKDLGFLVGKNFLFGVPPAFKDDLLKNNNIRIADIENTAIIYTFLNKRFIIITDSRDALEEMIKRFVLYKLSGIMYVWRWI